MAPYAGGVYTWDLYPTSGAPQFESTARDALEQWRTNGSSMEARLTAFDNGSGFATSTIPGASIVTGSITPAELDTDGVALVEGDVLQYNSANGKFQPINFAAAGDTFKVKKDAVDTAGYLDDQIVGYFANIYTDAEVDTLLLSYYTQVEVNNLLATGLDADYLDGQAGSYYQRALADSGSIELAGNVTGDRNAFIDFNADDTNAQSGRLIRWAGVNGILQLVQSGTGNISLNGGTSLTRDGNLIHDAGQDSGWQPLSLLATWVSFGGGFEVPQYRKLPSGLVTVKMAIKDGADNSIVANLPSGFRPVDSMQFLISVTDGITWGYGVANLYSNGDISCSALVPDSTGEVHINFAFMAI